VKSDRSLPVLAVLPALCRALQQSGKAVLVAPPGSGKTTKVPLELMDQEWLEGGRILMLEPRRLATRASAARMASLLGEKVGESVGYSVRMDRCISRRTRIEVVTEGILTRRVQRDPELRGAGLIVFDEFHERSLQADLALALCLDVATGLRDDLRLLVMSATLDAGKVSSLMGEAPVIIGEGEIYPVATHYLTREPKTSIPQTVTSAVLRALSDQQGDILAFLPGIGEIRRVEEQLRERLEREVKVCPLYADLGKEAQDQVIQPDPKGARRVVLATSIAETSLTIEGISTVVDSGWSRVPRFNPNNGLTRLETIRLSRASADQRAGRAGRLGPGFCYRLWTERIHSGLRPHSSPEILEADLAPLVLELAQWGVIDATDLNWMNPPPKGSFCQARELLEALEALDPRGRITSAGERMLGMAVHPRLAHMLLQSERMGQISAAADLAALLSERDVIRRGPGCLNSVDIQERLELMVRWRKQGRRGIEAAGGEPSACARVARVSQQLTRSVASTTSASELEGVSSGRLLAAAYPDRIAKRRNGGQGRYLLASGRGVRLPEGDPLAGSEYLVIADLDAGKTEGRIHLAAAIDLEQIKQTQKLKIKVDTRIEWESSSRSVVVREEGRLGSLVLSTRPLVNPDPDQVRKAMLAGIRNMGLDALPWSRTAMEWRARMSTLRYWQPKAGWPDLTDEGLMESLEHWLGPWLDGIGREEHLKRLDLEAILKGQLDWRRLQQAEHLAPTHLQVPSGSRKRLEYQSGGPPVLKVKLQEMFGLGDTPRVCDGRVPVMLHLLSPAQRPVQVTQDLKGFWERTYQEVKRELKGRYPKHYWPDNPWQAIPTARVKPRGK